MPCRLKMRKTYTYKIGWHQHRGLPICTIDTLDTKFINMYIPIRNIWFTYVSPLCSTYVKYVCMYIRTIWYFYICTCSYQSINICTHLMSYTLQGPEIHTCICAYTYTLVFCTFCLFFRNIYSVYSHKMIIDKYAQCK